MLWAAPNKIQLYDRFEKVVRILLTNADRQYLRDALQLAIDYSHKYIVQTMLDHNASSEADRCCD